MITQEAQDQEPVQMAAASFKMFTAISRLYLLRQRDVAKGVLFIVGLVGCPVIQPISLKITPSFMDAPQH
ncbi:hypothetical protein OG2516_17468 [Oceanicola granulosus HTCC2516]|uniref:Uncharacterized protein n=1 Tax=Oceanicola granulosus (strain ATCC BAA-861 / DSM 15982 / KCTC 12143 / HTCC2516) TaxID=314256 RepID=Q2CB90_OCEGH|nr:hypothetical protein OG2516_17468 [Oceanicola granulosus HTCC2516]